MKMFKWGGGVCLVAILSACTNTHDSAAKVLENIVNLTAVSKTESLGKSSDQTGCAEINFPQNLQYLNQVKCMSYPVRSEDVLDINTKKLHNGQFDLRVIETEDKDEFFSPESEFNERWKIVAKFPLNKEVTTFIVMNNLSMEGEGYAQTYNLFSINNYSGLLINDKFYYVGFDRRLYDEDLDFEYNENASYFLQDKPEIGKCTIHFEVSHSNQLERTRTCWNSKGEIERGPEDHIYDIKYENGQVEYMERDRD